MTDQAIQDLEDHRRKASNSSAVLHVPVCSSPHVAFDCLERALHKIKYKLILSSGVNVPIYNVSKKLERIRFSKVSIVHTNSQSLITTASQDMWADTSDILMGAAANPERVVRCGVNSTPVLAAGLNWQDRNEVPFFFSDGISKVFIIDGLSMDAPEDALLVIKIK